MRLESKRNSHSGFLPDRRRALHLLGGAGAAVFLGRGNLVTVDAADITCVAAAPSATEGPYWVDENLNRSDIRVDPANGSVSAGIPLTVNIAVQELSSSDCAPLAGAHVDIWHCDAAGLYSDESANGTVGRKFLRGYQVTDDSGAVNFVTVYPGWYSGRTPHIHVRVRTYNGTAVYDVFTSQFFFDDNTTDAVYTQSPYSARGTRDTRNTNDMVLSGMANPDRMMLSLTKTDQGYAATITIAVSLKTAASATPAIAANSVVNSASFQSPVAPGAWLTIFGQNLAASTRALTLSDLVSGNLPTSLGGVSVKIDGLDAFVTYVSPSQINLQAPADANTGDVAVTVTNAAGTSGSASVSLQAVSPAFFANSNYVAAVRADGTVITGSIPASPGDVLQLYGTGFGPTTPALAPGVVYQGSAPMLNTVTMTIGGVTVPVDYAGLVSTGLYQFNVTVPALADGDQAVIARTAGLDTQSGVLLKVKS